MDAQSFVKYEVVDPVSDQHLITESREEAIAYFEKNWTVIEHSITITIPSPFVSAQDIISVKWNDNPYFEV